MHALLCDPFRHTNSFSIFLVSITIRQAKKKKVDVMDAAEMGVDLTAKNEVLEVYDPPPRKEGIVVESVDELVDKLKNEAGVIQ